jgi:hypothetical protein
MCSNPEPRDYIALEDARHAIADANARSVRRRVVMDFLEMKAGMSRVKAKEAVGLTSLFLNVSGQCRE